MKSPVLESHKNNQHRPPHAAAFYPAGREPCDWPAQKGTLTNCRCTYISLLVVVCFLGAPSSHPANIQTSPETTTPHRYGIRPASSRLTELAIKFASHYSPHISLLSRLYVLSACASSLLLLGASFAVLLMMPSTSASLLVYLLGVIIIRNMYAAPMPLCRLSSPYVKINSDITLVSSIVSWCSSYLAAAW